MSDNWLDRVQRVLVERGFEKVSPFSSSPSNVVNNDNLYRLNGWDVLLVIERFRTSVVPTNFTMVRGAVILNNTAPPWRGAHCSLPVDNLFVYAGLSGNSPFELVTRFDELHDGLQPPLRGDVAGRNSDSEARLLRLVDALVDEEKIPLLVGDPAFTGIVEAWGRK